MTSVMFVSMETEVAVEWTSTDIGYTATRGEFTADLVMEEGRIVGSLSEGPHVVGEWMFSDPAIAMEEMAHILTEGIDSDH